MLSYHKEELVLLIRLIKCVCVCFFFCFILVSFIEMFFSFFHFGCHVWTLGLSVITNCYPKLVTNLLFYALDLYMKGKDVNKLASMLKLKAGRLAREVPDSCLQFWGGMGFTSEVEVSRAYRDNRLLSIGGGADEVMLSIICKYMGTFPKDQQLF